MDQVNELPAAGDDFQISMRRRLRIMGGLLILLILMGILLAIGSGALNFERVISESMEPTLLVGDEIFVDKNASVGRYDVIVLSDPTNPQDKLVKRVMGLPGDQIRIKEGVLYLNGKPEVSEHLPQNNINWEDMRADVPLGHYYVLGDNRNNSVDSLNFGPIPYESVRGKATLIIWPPSRWGRPQPLHGP